MADTVVGRWILANKEKYFPASLSLPENKANDLHEVIHRGWNEEDSGTVQEELKKELIKAYPNAFKPALPNGEYPTNEDAGFQEAMRRAGPVMTRKYGEFWPQGAVFKDFKWRIIDQLQEVEKNMNRTKSVASIFNRGMFEQGGRKSRLSKKSRKLKQRSRKTRRRI